MKAVVYLTTIVVLNGMACVGDAVFASEHLLVAELHSRPPAPCVSKAADDASALIAITSWGVTREEVRDHMAAFASIFLSSGADFMTSKYIATVYTAVFYEKDPINEVGIYGYRFEHPIDSKMFAAKPELSGELFVINNRLLLVLWHEGRNKTNQCFAAVKRALSGYTQ